MEYCTILCTTSDINNAKDIAKNLIRKRLIACCNIIPEVTSLYNWEDKMQEDSEILMIMKTKTELFDEIEKEIKKHHKYEIPEIISLPIKNGNAEYLNWIDKECSVKPI